MEQQYLIRIEQRHPTFIERTVPVLFTGMQLMLCNPYA